MSQRALVRAVLVSFIGLLSGVALAADPGAIASKSGDRRQVIHETADLWFHCLVLLARQQQKLLELAAEEGLPFGRARTVVDGDRVIIRARPKLSA